MDMEPQGQGQGQRLLHYPWIIILEPGQTSPYSSPADNGGRNIPPPIWVSSPDLYRRINNFLDAEGRRRRKRARLAAEEAITLGLHEVTAGPSREGEDCAICLNDFRADETLGMPCSHAFHRHCITEWLRRSAVCPLCRHHLPTTPEEDEWDDWVVDDGGSDQEDGVDGGTPEFEGEEEDDDVEWVDGAIGG